MTHLPVLAARSMLYDDMRTAGVNNGRRHRAYYAPAEIADDGTVDITRNWTGRRRDWEEIHSQLEIFFADRLPQ